MCHTSPSFPPLSALPPPPPPRFSRRKPEIPRMMPSSQRRLMLPKKKKNQPYFISCFLFPLSLSPKFEKPTTPLSVLLRPVSQIRRSRDPREERNEEKHRVCVGGGVLAGRGGGKKKGRLRVLRVGSVPRLSVLYSSLESVHRSSSFS